MPADVKFEEENNLVASGLAYRPPVAEKKSLFVRLAFSLSGGAIKTETQANYALIGSCILMIIISLLLVLSGGGEKVEPEKYFDPTKVTPDPIIQI